MEFLHAATRPLDAAWPTRHRSSVAGAVATAIAAIHRRLDRRATQDQSPCHDAGVSLQSYPPAASRGDFRGIPHAGKKPIADSSRRPDPAPVRIADLLRLLALAAIWGGSFLFMRIAAPSVGAVPVSASRVLLAALFLALIALVLRRPLPVRTHGRHFAIVGLLNSALPFLMFAYASGTLSASVLGVINATAPIWAALIGAVWQRTAPSLRTVAGLLIGIAGVSLLVGFDRVALAPGSGLPLAAALGATFLYGLSSQYTRHARQVEPFANAHGSMWGASLLLVPVWLATPQPAVVTAPVAAALLALGFVCTGVAYLLFFRLIADLGPSSALTVTFLVPVFAILWGHLFLGEAIGWHTAAGTLLVLTGTALVTGFSWRSLPLGPRRETPAGPVR